MIQLEDVGKFVEAAQSHYTYDLEYHNWGHAKAVMEGVDELVERAAHRDIKLARNALQVAAAWHDAGFHEDHTRFGFPTKEHYSAFLLNEYLADKPVSDEDKQLMNDAILGTIHNATRASLDTLALHRADIANIGGPYPLFLKNNIALWKEQAYFTGTLPVWSKSVASLRGFVEGLIKEAEIEMPRLGEPIGENDSFDVQALQNVERLEQEPQPHA